MAINEEIVTGRKFRKCIDVANKLWQRISFWTMACDVWFVDGKNAEEKLGNVDKVVNELKNKITSFENTKSTIVSSSLGRALGMAASNTWTQIVSKITSVANRGTLNWSGNNTTYTVPAGYYSGGTLDSRASYTAGYNKGKQDEAASHGGYRTGSFSVEVSSSDGYKRFTIPFNPSFNKIPKVTIQSNTDLMKVEMGEVTKQYFIMGCRYSSNSLIGDFVTGTVTWYAFVE